MSRAIITLGASTDFVTAIRGEQRHLAVTSSVVASAAMQPPDAADHI
jgi:hypothetical protein